MARPPAVGDSGRIPAETSSAAEFVRRGNRSRFSVMATECGAPTFGRQRKADDGHRSDWLRHNQDDKRAPSSSSVISPRLFAAAERVEDGAAAVSDDEPLA